MNPNKSNKNNNEDLSVYRLIKWGEFYLKDKNIANPFNESAVIMGYVVGKTLDGVILAYGDKLPRIKADLFKKLIKRRGKKEPVAYITNKKEFYSLDFFVSKSVLIPRPDTECLVEETLKEIEILQKISKKTIYILDIGTGSGAIAVSIANNSNNNVIIYGADNSYRCLTVAKKNIILNGVEGRVIPTYYDIFKSNVLWFNEKTGLFDNALSCFDIIVSNPPYIKTSDIETLDDDVKLYEPRRALDGGVSGLKFYDKIIDSVLSQDSLEKQCLFKGENEKTIIFEIDYREKSAIKRLCEEKFNKLNEYNHKGRIFRLKQITFINDLNNKERAVKIKYGQDVN